MDMSPENQENKCNCSKPGSYEITPSTADGPLVSEKRYACSKEAIPGVALNLSLDIRGITGITVTDMSGKVVIEYKTKNMDNVIKPAAKADLVLRYGQCISA